MRKLISVALCFLVAHAQCFGAASLSLSAATADRVDHGNTGNDPTASTGYVWMYYTGGTGTARRIIDKTQGSGVGQYSFFIAAAGSYRLRIFIDYATTDADAFSVDNSFSPNTWVFVAYTFDGTNAPKLYVGSQTNAVSEVTYVSAPVAPVGARNSDAGTSLKIGTNAGLSTGLGANVSVINFIQGTALSLNELRDHQFLPRPHPNSKIFSYYGFNGTGTQYDLSGTGNHGTVTGATESASGPPILIGGSPL